MFAPWKKSYDQPRQHIKKQRHYFANKGPSCQRYGFSSSHVWMWELHHKESWALKNQCFWTVVLEKSLSPLDCKEIQPVHPKGNQSWIFIGRPDAEAEILILWPPDVNWPIGKDPDAGKDWGQEEKGTTEDEVVGWHYQLDGHEFEQALGVGDGQGILVCWSPRGHEESDTNEQLNWTEGIGGSTWGEARGNDVEAHTHCFIHRTLGQSVQFSLVTQSCPTLWDPMQHTRPPCPSPTPRVHPNSSALSRWCHPAISSSVVPFSSCPQSLPESESFPVSQLFTWGGQSIGVSASTSVLPKNTQDWSPLEWTGWISLQSKGLSRASALGRPRGMVWGGRREEGSGRGTHVYLWQIHFDIWQN